MAQATVQFVDNHAATLPFIAADVGGTHARVALVRGERDRSAPVTVLHYRKYPCAEYRSLAAIIAHFLALLGTQRVDRIAIACAGYLIDDEVVNANLPWTVSLAELRQVLGLDDVALVNDFEAVAHAAHFVESADKTLLAGPDAQLPGGTMLVIGPGTGLGAAARIATPTGTLVLPTEAGQAALAPSTSLEVDVLRVLLAQQPHVANEHVLSGPGLVNLYHALCRLRGAPPALRAPAQITLAATSGTDALAREALDVFCGLLGSVTGDMVLLYGAQAGVCLAGGILPQIKEFLLTSTFRARFLNKGTLKALLERVPVWLIEHGQLGVIGAARWYLDRRRTD